MSVILHPPRSRVATPRKPGICLPFEPSPTRRIDPLAAHPADDQVVRPDLDEAFNAGPAPLVSAVRVAVPALPIRVGLVSKRSAGHDLERHGADGANSHRKHRR